MIEYVNYLLMAVGITVIVYALFTILITVIGLKKFIGFRGLKLRRRYQGTFKAFYQSLGKISSTLPRSLLGRNTITCQYTS